MRDPHRYVLIQGILSRRLELEMEVDRTYWSVWRSLAVARLSMRARSLLHLAYNRHLSVLVDHANVAILPVPPGSSESRLPRDCFRAEHLLVYFRSHRLVQARSASRDRPG